MTNEERICIYEKTIDLIKANNDINELSKAVVYSENYKFSNTHLNFETQIIVEDIDTC